MGGNCALPAHLLRTDPMRALARSCLRADHRRAEAFDEAQAPDQVPRIEEAQRSCFIVTQSARRAIAPAQRAPLR